MKAFITLAIIFTLPSVCSAQQSAAKSADCPLSHWSTTGAACFYTPDLPAREELKLQGSKTSVSEYLVISKPFVASSHFNFGLPQSALDSMWHRPFTVPNNRFRQLPEFK